MMVSDKCMINESEILKFQGCNISWLVIGRCDRVPVPKVPEVPKWKNALHLSYEPLGWTVHSFSGWWYTYPSEKYGSQLG